MLGLIFPHLQHQQQDQLFSDHPINTTTNTHNTITPTNTTTSALGVGVGVIPLLSSANTIQDSEIRETHLNCQKRTVSLSAIFNTGNSSSGIGTTTCKDCGNQAKKDCSHRRCRTCCRSHGFSCSTHVKSTWIPVARRRERQPSFAAAAAAAGDGSSASATAAKKARVIALESNSMNSRASTSNTTSSSSQQDTSFKGSLPGQVQAPAVFKCVRVTAIDNGEDEYVYQAMVKIRGHVFKGILYDQGVERRDHGVAADIQLSDLHLGGPGARNINGASPSPLLDHPDFYTAPGNGSVVAITYGNTMS